MNTNRSLVKKRLLSASIAALVGTTFGTPALAQEAGQLEEIVVTGLRASLDRAMDIKRDSSGVVDAISAEDIGKFPDANLAESLQRITGVSIDRVNGEGSQITVRGFGAANNMVTLNGRTLPAGYTYGGGSGAGGTSGGATRAFDFANLASESVAGVSVYKTGRASVPTGGIGATVDITTTKPLENDPLEVSLSAKGMHDTTVGDSGEDFTPEVSGLFSWKNSDNTVGLAVTASYSKRDSAAANAAENNWNMAYWDAEAHAAGENQGFSWIRDGDGNIAAEINGEPKDGQLFARPNDFRWAYSERSRDRANAQVTAQFAPRDDVTVTVDYTYADMQIAEHRGEWALWIGNGSSVEQVDFDNSGEIAVPLYIQEKLNNKDMGYEQQWREQNNTLHSFGFNTEWLVNDSLTLNFDAHDSSMDNMPDGPGQAGEIAMSVGAPVGERQYFWFGGDLPQGAYDWDDDNTNDNGRFDEPDFGTQQGRVFYASQEMDIAQVQFGGSQAFNEATVDFGLEYREMEMRQQNSNRQVQLGNWNVSNPGELYNILKPFNFAAQYDDYDTSRMSTIGMRAIDVYGLCQQSLGIYGDYDGNWDCSALSQHPNDNQVTEEITAAFVQYDNTFDLGGFETDVLLGLRYEETEVTSSALMEVPLYRPWESDNDFQTTVYADDQAFVAEDHSYDNLLPSLDVGVSVTDDVLARFSASQTIARPNYGNLFVSVGNFWQDNPTHLGGITSASKNDPKLDPLESTNIDLSVEWYFDDSSYASIGYFRKDVENFIGSGVRNEPHFGIRDPSAGPLVEQAEQALEARGISVNAESLFTMTAILDNPNDFPTGPDAIQVDSGNASQLDPDFVADMIQTYDIAPNEDSPLIQWRTTFPINQKEATIDGAELAFQHFFGDTGFGVQANYTIVDGDIGFDDTADPTEEQFALLGLSDTANLVMMYEKHGVQARLAWNWRDEFLRQTNQGGSNNPVYVDEYYQWDMSVSYEINDQFSVFVEGLNLTEENVRWRTRDARLTQYLEDLGARYQIGVRYNF
ncbi:TonB-dependent receptor [Marinimicrobium sp. C6131]|uniref:TonB-dependent receptor n=1 Tax=Marinimicrobium sp. C6131 TaxID=3022676 RepID=UPI00223D37CF|nr:TonB-dependent receptor [Marinimicrobium sp. C6131]UZJ43126.1 TonB-dependent receptor [Marinimicrobium sp. C6131]